MEAKFHYHIQKNPTYLRFFETYYSAHGLISWSFILMFYPIHGYAFREDYSLQIFQPNISQGYAFPISLLQTTRITLLNPPYTASLWKERKFINKFLLAEKWSLTLHE